MKGIDMLEIISNVDPKHIKAADEIYISNISHWSKRFSAIAACIAVLLVVGIGAWATVKIKDKLVANKIAKQEAQNSWQMKFLLSATS